MLPSVTSSRRVLARPWKPPLVLAGGPFVLRSLRRGLYRALVPLQHNSLSFQKYVRRLPLPVKSTVWLSAQLRAGVVGGKDEAGPFEPDPVARD